jgi:hypothetical protein
LNNLEILRSQTFLEQILQVLIRDDNALELGTQGHHILGLVCFSIGLLEITKGVTWLQSVIPKLMVIESILKGSSLYPLLPLRDVLSDGLIFLDEL